MTILDVVKSVAAVVDIDIPSVVYSSTDRTMIEMGVMANTCARQILEEYDWQRLKKIATITGDGVSTTFPLPADYDRMVKDANLMGRDFTFRAHQQITDSNQWLELQTYEIPSWEPRWSLFGGSFNILPALGNTLTLQYFYISNWIVNGTQTEFTADTDTFVLDERLLRLCMIWNWKAQKGQEYSNELQDYQEAMSRATFKDPGTRQAITGYSRYHLPTGGMYLP